MDLTYCNKQCPKGIEARNKFLDKNNSAYDAAVDFRFFVDECIETCPHKEQYNISK